MSSITYILLLSVLANIAYSIICFQRLKGADIGTFENCGDSCAFCHTITRRVDITRDVHTLVYSGGAPKENFEVFGCGCGENSIAKKLGPADAFKDCDGEFEAVSTSPGHSYTDKEKCCAKMKCS